MVRLLVNIGLAVIPFISMYGFDSRFPKEVLALFLCLAIGLSAIYTGQIKQFQNKWILFFVGFLFLSAYLAPKFAGQYQIILADVISQKATMLELGPLGISVLWVYKTILYAIVYMLGICGIASFPYIHAHRRQALNVMMWVGYIMALYIYVQKVGLDQFFFISTKDPVTEPGLVGTLGNSTIVSPFIAINIPFALWLGGKRNLAFAAIMAGAVILTKSMVAIFSMAVGLSFFVLAQMTKVYGRGILLILVAFLGLAGFGVVGDWKKDGPIKEFILKNDNGRVSQWVEIHKKWMTPPDKGSPKIYTMTGYGPGAYEYIYPLESKSPYRQAHNDYFQSTFDLGIIGELLILCVIVPLIGTAVWLMPEEPMLIALTSSLVILLVNSFGTFLLQLGPFQYWGMVIAGFMYGIIRQIKDKGVCHAGRNASI